MALSTARRNRSPGGDTSRPRGAAWSAADTRSRRTGAESCRARSTQIGQVPVRSIAGTRVAALANPTSAIAVRSALRSGSSKALSIRPTARRRYAVRHEATARTSRK